MKFEEIVKRPEYADVKLIEPPFIDTVPLTNHWFFGDKFVHQTGALRIKKGNFSPFGEFIISSNGGDLYLEVIGASTEVAQDVFKHFVSSMPGFENVPASQEERVFLYDKKMVIRSYGYEFSLPILLPEYIMV